MYNGVARIPGDGATFVIVYEELASMEKRDVSARTRDNLRVHQYEIDYARVQHYTGMRWGTVLAIAARIS